MVRKNKQNKTKKKREKKGLRDRKCKHKTNVRNGVRRVEKRREEKVIKMKRSRMDG